ncbi:RNA polymerase sigma-70 factor [Prolixibacteraceae bacterium JC049]|nr:RNA polymerase sigma-70 factor [Prolixibacteraceae bacterium JC049]
MSTVNNNEELFIVQKMIEGDRNAFKFFFDTYYSELCNFIHLYVHDTVISEEIAQNIFIYFWENRKKLKLTSSVKGYLFTTAKHRSLNHLRDKKEAISLSELNHAIHDNQLTDQFIELEELKVLLNETIESLPDRCKAIYNLSRNEGLTHKEIAAQLQITVKTVENQLTIALQRIRKKLHPFYEKLFVAFIIYWIN